MEEGVVPAWEEKTVSDSELALRLWEFLRASDLTTTTTASVRQRLEVDFWVDLSGKKAFIREQVDLFLQSQFDSDEGQQGHDQVSGGVKEEEGEEEERGDERGGDGQEGEEQDVKEKEED